MTTMTTETEMTVNPAALEAALGRLGAADRAARAWLSQEGGITAEVARGELLGGAFGADLMSSKLRHAAAVRDGLAAALVEARQRTTPATTRGTTESPPATLHELQATERAAAVGGDLAWAAGKLRAAILRAEPVVPLLRKTVPTVATIWIEAGRSLLLERHAAQREAIARTLAAQRAEIETFATLARPWGVAVGGPGPMPEWMPLTTPAPPPMPPVPAPRATRRR
jgi:hypothetical protein